MGRRKNNRKNIENNDLMMVIQRNCKPGEVNINGCKYTLESYNNALSKWKELNNRDAELFFIKDNYNPYTDICGDENFYTIDLENSAAKIIDVGHDSVLVKFKNKFIYDLVSSIILKGYDISINMRYIGNLLDMKDKIKTYDITNIITFDIIAKYPDIDIVNYKDFIYNLNKRDDIDE